jgi:hypothetical protein
MPANPIGCDVPRQRATEDRGSAASGMAEQQGQGLWLGGVREGYAEIGDVQLHYIEAGEGPLIVLLHGFPRQRDWLALVNDWLALTNARADPPRRTADPDSLDVRRRPGLRAADRDPAQHAPQRSCQVMTEEALAQLQPWSAHRWAYGEPPPLGSASALLRLHRGSARWGRAAAPRGRCQADDGDGASFPTRHFRGCPDAGPDAALRSPRPRPRPRRHIPVASPNASRRGHSMTGTSVGPSICVPALQAAVMLAARRSGGTPRRPRSVSLPHLGVAAGRYGANTTTSVPTLVALARRAGLAPSGSGVASVRVCPTRMIISPG